MKNLLAGRHTRIEPLETRIAPAFVSGIINLADLSGGNGSEFGGVAAGDSAGYSVSAAGDVNGDGFGDFIIGAPTAELAKGAAYVIFGTSQGFPAEVTLNATFLNGTKGFRLLGQATALGGENAGYSVGAAGDVNGDGFDDLIVGAPFANPNGNGSGAAYVVFGKAGAFAATVSLASLDGSNGFKLSGGAGSDNAGGSVSGAGDVNGDGFDDVIVGAVDAGGKGAAYIVFGKAGGFAANLTLSGLTAAQGVQLDGVASGDRAGRSVSGAGDVNGDGFADVVVGANGVDQIGNGERGAAYVVFGGSTLPATIALGGIGGGTGFRVDGAVNGDYAGTSVGAAGDVNGDGFADVLVGARRDGMGGPFTGPGVAYVVFGGSGIFAPVFTLGTAGATIAFTGAAGELAGVSAKSAGDVNGDGIDDLILGASQNSVSGATGRAYVVFGRADIATAPPLLSALDGSNGFRLSGEDADSRTGGSVSGAGDVNGDGFADMLVGASSSDDGGADIGKAYLVLGGPSGALVNPIIATGGKSATFTDVDGDLVTVKVTKGTLTNANFSLIKATATAPGAQLIELSLGATFDGTDVSITAKRAGDGDGRVNVGLIYAFGVDLGKVTIAGDLGAIYAGDNVADLGLKSLAVRTMGIFEGRTADTGLGFNSQIVGGVGAVKIAGDFHKATFNVFAAGTAAGTIGSLTIGGDMVGGKTPSSGQIFGQNLGTAKIGGSMLGSTGQSSAALFIIKNLGALTVGGSIRGGSGDFSGQVSANDITGSVKLGGSLVGGFGFASARIVTDATLGNVTIGGSQIGSGFNSASIVSNGNIGRVSIGGDQVGGGKNCAYILAEGNIAGVTIGGDARPGTAPGAGGIFATGSLGPVVIKGDVLGTAQRPFFINGGGPLTGSSSLAIAKVTIGGDFEHGIISSSFMTAPGNGHGQIGPISVGGDWIASSVAAGVTDAAGNYLVLGNGGDKFATGGPAGVVAYIQSVTIKGTARGTLAEGDRFAIVAEEVGSLTIGGRKVPLTPGIANDLAGITVGPTPDFVIREISRTAAQPADPVVTLPPAGPRTSIPGTINLGTLAGGDGATFTAPAGANSFGRAVRGAGDVNGDGFDDFLIGANFANEGGDKRGAAYLVFGTALGLPSLTALDGFNGFKIRGERDKDYAGGNMAAAGDVNGDGFDDVLITTNNADTGTNRGTVHVIYGRADFSGTGGSLVLGGLTGAEGFEIPGLADSDFLSANGAGGDVNGDGFADLLLSAFAADEGGSNRGAAYVVFGGERIAQTPGLFDLATLDGANGFKVSGLANNSTLSQVTAIGDINGDGTDDLAMSDANFGVQVIFGASDFTATGGSFDLTQLNGTNGFKVPGTSIPAGAGDVNGDGFADLAVREYGAEANASRVYVIYGKSSFAATTGSFSVATINGTNGFRFSGLEAGDKLGRALGAAGDMNGDGFADLFATSREASGGGTDRGETYVIFGKPDFSANAGVVSLSGLDGSNGFRLRGGADGNFAGEGSSAVGDVNGDGFTDLLIGSRVAAQAYVVFGGPSGEFIDPTFSNGGKTVMWTDVDGDQVTLKVSKGTLDATNFKLLGKSTFDNSAQLLALNLGSEFEGADVSLTAKRAGGGDGRVNAGLISAQNVDLGKVTISGDLGRILVGDSDATPALKSLTVGSIGVFGGRTQDTGGNIRSEVFGPVGAVKVLGDVRDATLVIIDGASPGATGSVASFTVGGSLIGGERGGSGSIFAQAFGPVKIAGDLVGGRGFESGYLLSFGNIGAVTVGGSMLGGDGSFSGAMQSFGRAGNITIGGGQHGGNGFASGAIFTAGNIGKISIKGDQIGGGGVASALIFANGGSSNIASVNIGGDVRGGDVIFSGGILAGGTLGPVSIKGDVVGTAEQAYLIRGAGPLTGTKSIAIAGVKVGGDFDHALILAGYGQNNTPENGHAQIGAISVGGNWIASSVTAGLVPRSLDFKFGTDDEVFIPAGPAGVVASIASITIKGRAIGTFPTGDRFGIVAEQIGSATIDGMKLPFTKGPGNDNGYILGITPDFAIYEVARVI